MIVHVEDIRHLIAKYRAAMDLDPAKVELYENGEKVEVPEQFIKDWKFCGLGFCGFIETDFYKTGFVDEAGNPCPLTKDTDDRTGTETTGG